jgi:energy-coupling factor transporter transmembrane protein EcfT
MGTLINIFGFYIQSFGSLVVDILKNLEPSLFQNVILGILAIFIPILVVFLDEKDQDYLQIESIKNELLKVKSVFWLSIITIFIFAIYKNLDLNFRFLSLIIVLILVFFLIKIFFEILSFSRKEIFKYEKNYLKNLDINTAKDDLQNSCQALWSRSETFYSNEKEFTDIFIKHIDEAIKLKKLDFAVRLAQIYVENIEKRYIFIIGNTILPKILEWDRVFWTEYQIYLENFDKNTAEISSYYFWNWHFFGIEFFSKIIIRLLQDNHGPYELFSKLRVHVESIEHQSNKTQDQKEKQQHDKYIDYIMHTFCSTIFGEIDKTQFSYEIWQYYFPSEWKISIINKDNRISRIILHEFRKWAEDKIFQGKKGKYDNQLTQVINGIFPNIDSSLFTSFLMISYSNNSIKYALEKVLNFYILGASAEGTFSNGESKEDIDRIISNKLIQKESDQKKETIQIIIEYFHFWSILKYYKNDLSEDENQGWVNFTKEKRQSIIIRIREEKLKNLKKDLESEEIMFFCKDSSEKEDRRQNFLKLIKLLIEEIKNPG